MNFQANRTYDYRINPPLFDNNNLAKDPYFSNGFVIKNCIK